MNAQRSTPNTGQEAAQIDPLIERQRVLLSQLSQIEARIEQVATVQQRRHAAMRPLRRRIKCCRDVESPVDVVWAAEQ